MYRIAICDNRSADGAHTKTITAQVMQHLRVEAQSDLFFSAELLLAALARGERYDLFLLDALVEGMGGIALAAEIRKTNRHAGLVFVTGCPDYAIDGYKVWADDYILKPMTCGALEKTMRRLFSSQAMLTVEDREGLRLVRVAGVRYVEAFGHVAYMHTADERIMVRGTLEAQLRRLGEGAFIRCHKSYLVNLEHIQALQGREIQLMDGHVIPVGRRYYVGVQTALMSYAERSRIHLE